MTWSEDSRPFIHSLAMLRAGSNTPAMPASSWACSGWVALLRIEVQKGSRDSTPCQSEKITRPGSGTWFIRLPVMGTCPVSCRMLRCCEPRQFR